MIKKNRIRNHQINGNNNIFLRTEFLFYMWTCNPKKAGFSIQPVINMEFTPAQLPVGEVNLLCSAHKNDPPGCVEPGAGALQGPNSRAHSSTHLK